MSRYIVEPIVCDYQVIDTSTFTTVCMCNLQSNAEYIADILNADGNEQVAYTYNEYFKRKWNIEERNMEFNSRYELKRKQPNAIHTFSARKPRF